MSRLTDQLELHEAEEYDERKYANLTSMNAEINKNESLDFNVLPLFEKQFFDSMVIQKNSLQTNEKLRSRWLEVVRTGRQPASSAIPRTTNDVHFHNCCTKFNPSISTVNCKSYKFHLMPGPGVDKYGQRPIPDDMTSKTRYKPSVHRTSAKSKIEEKGDRSKLVKRKLT